MLCYFAAAYYAGYFSEYYADYYEEAVQMVEDAQAHPDRELDSQVETSPLYCRLC